MLRSSVSLVLFVLLAASAPNALAGSNSDANEGCQSGSPGSGSSEGNDQMAVSQSSQGGSSGSSSQRGASGSVNSGSYKPRVNGTSTHRFERAGSALATDPAAFKDSGSEKIAAHVFKAEFTTEGGYNRAVFRMNKLVDWFVSDKQGLPAYLEGVEYNDESRGYDIVIMHVPPELAGKATPQLKRKVAAWLKTKLQQPAVAAHS